MKNAYPNLREEAYERTSILPSKMAAYLNNLPLSSVSLEQRRAAFAIFLNESGSGRKGVNNNYFGFQADGGQLPEAVRHFVKATCIEHENMTGNERRFCVFDSWQDCLEVALYVFVRRGLFIGGTAQPYSKNLMVKDVATLADAYWNEWVVGDCTGASKLFRKEFGMLYRLGVKSIGS